MVETPDTVSTAPTVKSPTFWKVNDWLAPESAAAKVLTVLPNRATGPAELMRKFFTLNCAQAVAAYLGYRHDCKYIHEAVAHSEVAPIVAAALRDEQVSMESMIQRGRAPGEAVPVVLTTHVTSEAAMRRALKRIEALETVLEPPHMIRIEDF